MGTEFSENLIEKWDSEHVKLPAPGILLEVGCGEDTCLQGSKGLVFSELKYPKSSICLPCGDRHLQIISGHA